MTVRPMTAKSDMSCIDSDAHLALFRLTQSGILSSKLSCMYCLSSWAGKRIKPTVACLKSLASQSLTAWFVSATASWINNWLKQEFIKTATQTEEKHRQRDYLRIPPSIHEAQNVKLSHCPFSQKLIGKTVENDFPAAVFALILMWVFFFLKI